MSRNTIDTSATNHWASNTLVEREAAPAKSILRRRVLQKSMAEKSASRSCKMGAIAMATTAVGVLAFRRLDYDNPVVMIVEMLLCTLTLAGAAYAVRVHVSNSKTMDKLGTTVNHWVVFLVSTAVVLPWAVDVVARRMGFGNGFEIVMLSSLAWGGVAAACVGERSRTVSLSVVCSGFLTLFSTFISDSSTATVFAYAWGAICLWWLVSNHWEQVESCEATQVITSKRPRFVVIAIGSIAILSTTLLVSNRIPIVRKLRAELMPTSGGTGDKDAAARSGVGNGDALVAARDHASTFGAVETDLFLDSPTPSLFDVFSEEFGPPRKTTRVEKAQALSLKETKSEEGKFAEANRSSSNDSFNTQRDAPRKRPVVNDLTSESLFFWSGQPGERLAVERYATFDGVEWHKEKRTDGTNYPLVEPQMVELGNRTWFYPTGRQIQNSISPFVGSLPEAIKFTRFRSPVIPSRVGVQLWSIDQLNRPDMFGVSHDECLSMPDREHVPDYTVVRFVNSGIDLQRLEELMRNCSPGQSHWKLSDSCKSVVARLAHSVAGKQQRGLEQVFAVIEELRSRFKLERTTEDSPEASDGTTLPIEQFIERRAGPSYLFATTASLMLQHLGYQTRLVTGFYANPTHHVARENEIAVLPQDAHVWLEINAGHGFWIPLEPTPGFEKPRYSMSLWYRLYKAKVEIAVFCMLGLVVTVGTYLLRRSLFEIMCRLVWPLVSLLDDRRKVACLTRVLDQRLRLAGTPRPVGTIQRALLLHGKQGVSQDLKAQDLTMQMQQFFNESDRLCFGGAQCISSEGREAVRCLWNALTVHSIQRSNHRLIRNEH